MAKKKVIVRNAITNNPLIIEEDENKTFREACKSYISIEEDLWVIFDEDGNDLSDVKLKDFQGQAYLGPSGNVI